MRKGTSDIVIDLRGFSVYGDVLDMGFRNDGIMYRIIKKGILSSGCDEAAATSDDADNSEDCDWVSGRPDNLPFGDAAFDSAVLFFSLSYIFRKKVKNKLIKEIERVLKDRGKLYIWDFNKKYALGFKRKIKVILPGSETSIIYRRQPGLLSNYKMEGILPVIERYFTVQKSSDSGASYFIEAGKK